MLKAIIPLVLLLHCLSLSLRADAISPFTAQTVSDYFPAIPLSYRSVPYFDDDSEAATRAKTFEQTIVDGLKAMQSEINISAYQIPPADMTRLYFAVLYRHPEIFWSATGHNGGRSNGKYVTVVYPLYNVSSKTEMDAMSVMFNAAVNQAISMTSHAGTAIEKALILHDWLATHCTFDSEHTCTYRTSAYGALVNGSAVCQGYSMAYNLLLSKVGIAGDFVLSDSMNHAWNLVTIDGQKYHVDVTWDDGTDTQDLSAVEHVYFLLNDQGIKTHVSHHLKDHTGWNDEVTYSSSSDRFNNYFWRSTSIQVASIPCFDGYAYVFDQKKLKKYRLSDGVCVNDSCLTSSGHAVAARYGDMLVYNTASQVAVYNPQTGASQTIPFSYDNRLGQIYSFYQNNGNPSLQAVIASNSTQFSYIDIPWTHVTSISLSKTNVTISSTTKDFRLNATVMPTNCTCGEFFWSSSKTDIATVDSTGVITPLSLGQTTITATTLDGSFTASCLLTVTMPPATVTLSAKTAALRQNSLDGSGTVATVPQWGTVTGNGTVATDSDVTLTAIPMTGYTVAYWIDSLSGCNFGFGSPTVTVCAQNNTTLTAVFKRAVYSYQAVSSDLQLGTVSPALPVDTLFEATETFTAHPANGCVFLAWVDPANQDAVVSYSPEWTTPITRDDTSYRAIFAQQNDARLLTHITIQPSAQELPSGEELSIAVTAFFNDGSKLPIDHPKLTLDIANARLARLDDTQLANTNTTRSTVQATVTATFTDKTISQNASCTVTLQGIPDACLYLQPGWNLIGFCAMPTPASLSSLQQEVTIRSFQKRSRTYVTATNVSLNTGYVVFNNSQTAAKLPFDSCKAANEEPKLQVGWNIIGIPQTLSAEQFYLNRTDLTFWKLDSTGKYIRVCPDQLEKGQGYLVHRSPGF